ALRHSDVTEELVDGAEADAKIKIAGGSLFHIDNQVFQVRHVRGLDAGLYFARDEILQSLAALLAQFDAVHVKHLARRDGQFAPDHLVLRLGISANLNYFNPGGLALLDLVDQVDRAPLGVGVPDCRNRNPFPLSLPDISVRAVKILDRLDVLLETLGRKNLPLEHPWPYRSAEDHDSLTDLFGGEPGVALEFHGPDLVTLAFINDEADRHARGTERVELHLPDLEVDVALVPVEILQLLLVFLELFLLEPAAA